MNLWLLCLMGMSLCLMGCGSSEVQQSVEVVPPASTQTTDETELLEDAILAEVNKYREQNGRTRLMHDPEVRRLARGHSKNMSKGKFFDHTDPVRGDVSTRLRNGGVYFSAASENLAYLDRDPVNPKSVLKTWVDSYDHHRNLLSRDYEQTGLGVYRNKSGEYYVTQIFLTR